MKMMKSVSMMLMAGLVAMGIVAFNSPKSAYSQEIKIGYVSFERLFEQYEKTKEKNELLQKKKYDKEVEGQKLVDDINKLRNEIQILSDDAKESKQKEMNEKMRKLRDFTNNSKEELLKERDLIFKDLTKEINKVIDEKGKTDGYTLILDDQILLYKAKANDMTDEIIKILNDRYSKEKSATGAKDTKAAKESKETK
jgi:outer membrane protein